MPRTKFPEKIVRLNGRELSKEEVAELERIYKPPLTADERLQRQVIEGNLPDMSHFCP